MGKPIRLLERGLSHDYRMTAVVLTLTGAPNVHKSSCRATLCLTDLVRIAKQVRRQVYAASVPKRLWLHESHQELIHVRIRLRHGFQ